MTKDNFKNNLNGAVDSLMELTKTLCSNSFSSNYRFVVKPNIAAISSHLNDEEILFHTRIVTYENKYISNKEVIDLLWVNNKVPLWINTSVSASTDTWTTVELMTSRRLRPESELNKIADQFPPFHVQVLLPNDHIKGVKFDVNWQNRKRKGKGFWDRIKRIVFK